MCVLTPIIASAVVSSVVTEDASVAAAEAWSVDREGATAAAVVIVMVMVVVVVVVMVVMMVVVVVVVVR